MVGGWLFDPVLHVRWTTILMTAVMAVAVAARTRRVSLAVVATVAWLASYEIVWQAVDLVFHARTSATSPGHLAWLAAALLAWPLLARTLGIRPHLGWLAAAASLFAIWIWSGFDYNFSGQHKPYSVWPEILNVGSKTGLGLAYLFGALRLPAGRPESPPLTS